MEKQLTQLDIDELHHLCSRIDDDPDGIAVALFPDQPTGRIELTEKIGEWAINYKVALEHSEDKPDVALIFKKVSHRIWQELPTYAKCVRVRIE